MAWVAETAKTLAPRALATTPGVGPMFHSNELEPVPGANGGWRNANSVASAARASGAPGASSRVAVSVHDHSFVRRRSLVRNGERHGVLATARWVDEGLIGDVRSRQHLAMVTDATLDHLERATKPSTLVRNSARYSAVARAWSRRAVPLPSPRSRGLAATPSRVQPAVLISKELLRSKPSRMGRFPRFSGTKNLPKNFEN
jgi:hypothetical protein